MRQVFPFAFPLFFAGMWTGVSYLLSRMSGWSALAERCRARAAPEGERLLWRSGRVGGVSFRSCLNLTLAPSGLHLVPSLLFRLFMPALLVPWTEVRFEGFKRILFLEFACYRLGSGGPILAVDRPTGERLHPFVGKDSQAAFMSARPFGESLIDRRIWIAAAAAAVLGLMAALTAAKR